MNLNKNSSFIDFMKHISMWTLTFKGLIDSATCEEMIKSYGLNWISTDDDLPDNAETVLCFTRLGWIVSNSYEIGTQQDKEWFKTNFSHWRHLPEKP